MCKREVFDLTEMTDGERVAFMKGCSGEVCVSYRISVRTAVAAAALIAAIGTPAAAIACDAVDTVVVSGGGIKDPANAQYIQVPDNKATPSLPVVYEDGNRRQDVRDTASRDTAPNRAARNTE